ncbi:MAG TPA: hypothetical protein VF791_15650 [Pyrinomonadaceae bacterium]
MDKPEKEGICNWGFQFEVLGGDFIDKRLLYLRMVKPFNALLEDSCIALSFSDEAFAPVSST